ncbi:HAMP domain-containing sensor histidine kinase [Pseudoalteromonas piscicida]|uniref:sensor histidine kinase n=1 Tax=Pseudoalteromonas piscicida TaxID=43662 RepID=UPI0030AE8263
MAKLVSLEQKLWLGFAVPLTTLVLLVVGIIFYFELTFLSAMTLFIGVLMPSLLALHYSYKKVMLVLDNLAVQLDSITNEELSVWQLATYHRGRVATLKAEVKSAVERLKQRRQEYGQNEAFVFNFISELTLPILVLDAHQHVYFANRAMSAVYPEGTLHGLHASALSLSYVDKQWQLQQQSARYSIVSHPLYRGQRVYQLLVFFSVEQTLRDNEKQVWQKLLSVLNHEVRNSLTPVYSMAQSLRQDRDVIPLETQHTMLGVIESRAAHLQQFVANYAQIAQLPPVEIQAVEVESLVTRWRALFPKVVINVHSSGVIYCDEPQLTQAMINLVNNAEQANQSSKRQGIRLTIQRAQDWLLCLEDNGGGIDNQANLFVPFYSTKPNGSGIGLVMSREIIRNQQGELRLSNLANNQGARAEITLPV